jgi:hypothetical protein
MSKRHVLGRTPRFTHATHAIFAGLVLAHLAGSLLACEISDRQYVQVEAGAAGDSGGAEQGDAAPSSLDGGCTPLGGGTDACVCPAGYYPYEGACYPDEPLCTSTSKPQSVKGTCMIPLPVIDPFVDAGADGSVLCEEFTGGQFTDQSLANRTCSQSKGVYTVGATCDRSQAFGACLESCGGGGEIVQVLAPPAPASAQSAATECTGSLNGTWIANDAGP